MDASQTLAHETGSLAPILLGSKASISTSLAHSTGIIVVESSEDGGVDLQPTHGGREVKALHLDRYQARALLAVLADAVR